ncbi:MAG: hypothetical protein ACI8RZ_002288 [Myxococcota bacterium]|jgi:hypothetical protein
MNLPLSWGSSRSQTGELPCGEWRGDGVSPTKPVRWLPSLVLTIKFDKCRSQTG